MNIGNKQYKEIIVTEAVADPNARLVTADEKEVLAVISDNEVITKKGFQVKLVPATKE